MTFRQEDFAAPQFLPGDPAFGHVLNGAEVLEFSVLAVDLTRVDRDVFGGAVRHHKPILVLTAAKAFSSRVLFHLPEDMNVVGMDTGTEQRALRRHGRIDAGDAVHLRRPHQLFRGRGPQKAAHAAQMLRFGEESLTAAQSLVRPPARRDVLYCAEVLCLPSCAEELVGLEDHVLDRSVGKPQPIAVLKAVIDQLSPPLPAGSFQTARRNRRGERASRQLQRRRRSGSSSKMRYSSSDQTRLSAVASQKAADTAQALGFGEKRFTAA